MKLGMGLLILLFFIPMLPSFATTQVSVKLTFDLKGVPQSGWNRSGLPVLGRSMHDKDDQLAGNSHNPWSAKF